MPRPGGLKRHGPTRLKTLRRAEALLAEHVPIIPIYVYTRSELVKPYLKGHHLNYQHRQLFKNWWIDPAWSKR